MTRPERARFALDALRAYIPRPETELHFRNPYELLVAVVLSAQCTDARVNLVTPALFEAYPTVYDLAKAEASEIFPYIRSISYPNNKAQHLAGAARRIVEVHGGEVPGEFDALVALPGVGRKTAQVILSIAFDVAALPVDTHVFRVANRIGMVGPKADTPLKVERDLKRVLPESTWGEAHHLLILHGRYTCTARAPQCEKCPVAPGCLYYEAVSKLPAPLEGLDPKKGRYFSPSSGKYFDTPLLKTDRQGVEQLADPYTGAMNVFETKTGKTMRRVKDFRV